MSATKSEAPQNNEREECSLTRDDFDPVKPCRLPDGSVSHRMVPYEGSARGYHCERCGMMDEPMLQEPAGGWYM